MAVTGGAAALGSLAAVLLLPLLLICLYNLLTAPRLERAGPPLRWPRVALLVPARNEAGNLARLLPALLAIDYPELEVLVLDDASHDATADVVSGFVAASAGRLRLIRGAPLPVGWLGKSWACQQLAEATRAELLIFCDADVVPAPNAVRETVAAMQASGADALTALPRHRLGSWAEAAVVPLVVQIPALALLPLRQVRTRPEPALSIGNGQWLALTRFAYRVVGGHSAVRRAVVEDVAIARRVKEAGLGLLPVLATRSLEVRMYTDAASVRAGLRRNLFPLVGGQAWCLVLAVGVTLLLAVLPWALLFTDPGAAALPVALLLAIRITSAIALRHGWRSVLMHPVGAVAAAALMLDSFHAHLRGRASWKGRGLGSTGALDTCV